MNYYVWLLTTLFLSTCNLAIVLFLLMIAYQAYFTPWRLERERAMQKALEASQSGMNDESERRFQQIKVEAAYWRILFGTYGFIAGGLLLIFLPLTIYSYRGYDAAQPPSGSHQTLTVFPPPSYTAHDFTVRADRNEISEDDSLRLTLSLVPSDSSNDRNTPRSVPRGMYYPEVIAANFDVAGAFTEPTSAREDHGIVWVYELSAKRDGNNPARIRYGRQLVQTTVSFRVNGQEHYLTLGPYIELNVKHRLTDDIVLANAGSLLSFALGVLTILIGVLKKPEKNGEQRDAGEAVMPQPRLGESTNASALR